MSIDWKDQESRVSRYFTVREAIWLPKWNRLACASDGFGEVEKANLYHFLNYFVDPVRDVLKAPMIVHCCYRPIAYNALVGGATESSHRANLNSAAIDFHPDFESSSLAEDCRRGRELLMPYLDTLGIRMEDNGPEATWIHIDNHVIPGHLRFFKP